ncbi:hypothetical protein RRG08_026307 [Elysia crispata]|uniref:MORN repeat-containing protein 1 n=1 Tax=Elysia crispata TaxID=231223 RepID=A0AAE1DDE1_9GAST|nr:hypothetical protein RRG08_026307 [Elysia crispata]
MAATTDGNRREPYVGEKRKFLRDGFGTYVFENSFFRYEGEWMKGKKHGHGKLLMKDGTYYEGQFINGEINGNGYKFFASSKAKYTGQFLNGEMHGHGIMTYHNGNVYEGQWYKNKKQGFGILRTSDKAVYEGTFHGHVRDGEGTQTYDGSYQKLSNGDRYEGYWVLDQRNGHGDLWCADGSHYCGNFTNDMFHGAGVMTHASGIVYRGDWINGFPITMATKIVLLDVPESPMIIRQGQPFSIRVECRNDEDELVEDQGREIQVMAGFKYRVPKQGSALFDMIEDVEDTPIPTPFGYDVVPYPLTDQLGEVSVSVTEDDSKMSTMVRDDEAEDKGEEEGEEDGQEEQPDGGVPPTGREVTEDLEAAASVAASMAALLTNGGEDAGADLAAVALGEEGTGLDGDLIGAENSRPITPGDSAAEDGADGSEEKPEEVTHLPPPMCSKPTLNGVCEWDNLQLAPAPPMYRPFVIMEEEAGPKKKSKAAQIREKIERKNSQNPAAMQKSVTEAEKPAASDEKVARTGEYVLIVQDVTSPPFMGRRLEPAFLLMKLKKPKKIIVKKPNIADRERWDTQRHILAAMSRATGSES